MSKLTNTVPELGEQGAQGWPMEVRALLQALETEAYVARDRRASGGRRRYQTQAIIWFKDADDQPRQTTVYTRDATERGVAFLTQQFFKPGQSIVLEIAEASGARRFQGHIRRCRQFRGGWFEGVLQFPSTKRK